MSIVATIGDGPIFLSRPRNHKVVCKGLQYAVKLFDKFGLVYTFVVVEQTIYGTAINLYEKVLDHEEK